MNALAREIQITPPSLKTDYSDILFLLLCKKMSEKRDVGQG